MGSSAFARRYLRNLFDFSSSGYLDVSVHPVPSTHPMCSDVGDEVLPRRVSPFGHPRIKALVQLPWAFRRLRALRRQRVPRHSPCTLSRFTKVNSRSDDKTRCYAISSSKTLCGCQRTPPLKEWKACLSSYAVSLKSVHCVSTFSWTCLQVNSRLENVPKRFSGSLVFRPTSPKILASSRVLATSLRVP